MTVAAPPQGPVPSTPARLGSVRQLKAMYLRISITDRCNLRCVYCLPEAARFATTRASPCELMRLTDLINQALPVRKIRITGGEPTVSPNLLEHVRHAATITSEVGLTSNGVLLEPLLPALRDAGLSRVNISLDALDAPTFERVSRRPGQAQVIASIRAARRCGFPRVKVNVVAMQDTDVASLVRFAAWESVHLRFIELMAIGEARSLTARYLGADEMRMRIAAAGVHMTERRELDEATARIWTLDGQDAQSCSIGFITTRSAPFCASCDRVRLSSQGRLFTCLMDNRGTDLLTPLRAGNEAGVVIAVAQAVGAKQPPLEFIRHEAMASIGG